MSAAQVVISTMTPSMHPRITFYHADTGLDADLDQDAVQVLPPPSDPLTRQDWETHRTIFTQLYRTENRSLKEVMRIMADQYNFKATPRMFKKRVIDWKLQKNYKAAEREAVARVVERYKNHGDPIPTILLRGQPVKMHRIQRHCKIGQSVTGPFESAGSFGSSVWENDAGQIQPEDLTAEYSKEIYPMDDIIIPANDLQNMAALFAIPLRQISPPDELKHAEIVIFQTNAFYESFAQSMVTSKMKGNTALVSQAEIKAQIAVNPGAFASKVTAALSSLISSQPKVGWRLLYEAMDMIRPMLASKHPYNLRTLLNCASIWELFLPPDFYRVIWNQISEMASIVLGESDPFSKVCLALLHIKSKTHVYEIVVRLMSSVFERILGPYDFATLEAKSHHVRSLLANRDFASAEHLQRLVISNCEELGNECIRRQEVAYQVYQLGRIFMEKGDFTGAKKVFLDALRLGRLASGERFPTQTDLYCITDLVSTLAKDEYIEGEVLLHEALEKCVKNEHWGRYDWHTVSVLGSLENLFKIQEKFHEAEMLRSQYPEAF